MIYHREDARRAPNPHRHQAEAAHVWLRRHLATLPDDGWASFTVGAIGATAESFAYTDAEKVARITGLCAALDEARLDAVAGATA